MTRSNDGVSTGPDLSKLTHAEEDALILALLARLDEARRLIAELRARVDELSRPGKTPDNSSLPPSQGGSRTGRRRRRAEARARAVSGEGGGRSPRDPMRW